MRTLILIMAMVVANAEKVQPENNRQCLTGYGNENLTNME